MSLKYIFVNLKRFDIPKEMGGVNSLAPMENWAKTIIEGCKAVDKYGVTTTFFFPEVHILNAVNSYGIAVGCQGVHAEDTETNFGAFTTYRPASTMKAAGCEWAIIGHCEERKTKSNAELNAEIKRAMSAGLKVLYCIGEKTEEQPRIKEVLAEQIKVGLDGVDINNICVAYEPVWAIGPGKIPPDRDYIVMASEIIKSLAGVPVIYGGGLKEENAAMLASIPTIDGGLIALTRFAGDIGFYPDEFLKIVETYVG